MFGKKNFHAACFIHKSFNLAHKETRLRKFMHKKTIPPKSCVHLMNFRGKL